MRGEHSPSAFSDQTFTLPVGLVDSAGRRHRCGTLRTAAARDEVRTLQDFRVHLRPESFLPLMLARTIVRLGDLERLDVPQLESLCAADLDVLSSIYTRVMEKLLT